MIKKMKQYSKNGIEMAKAGIGLSALSSLDSTGSTSKLSNALPMAGSVISTGMAIDSIKYLNKKK
jgi:hypothetical protein